MIIIIAFVVLFFIMAEPPSVTKTGITIVSLLCAASFALGYRLADSPTVKTKVDTEETRDVKKDEDTHTSTKIVKVKEKGKVTTTTVIEQIKNTTTEVKSEATAHVEQTVEARKAKWNVSLLAGTRLVDPDGVPLYGASFTKEFIGPITAGAWALNNGTVGISIGVDF